MSSVSGDEGFPPQWDDQGSSAHEEKIYVSIRVRPLNDREISRNDVADWECINNTTILFKNSFVERSSTPTAYQFDRVFGSECSTREVYNEAAKRVFLSVLSGINSSIFAYGQTSSGKTYTMSGVTEYAVQDIYEYINKHTERKFVLKFSAIEIYNEVVRDLLSSDNIPLRLLDDPERGTVVEKLLEVTLRDQSHLSELLSICEAQRQIGETSLNGMSSRSHQILRLTVESSANQYSRSQNNSTLSAAVNFVDLAGSERASQTLSAGTRLKEGCHINRSLLTLGTVIRKLSKGRNGHIPYRDSKLTRILQNSLGGNARTAIICTMSPAHSHVEQSRNTLLFATCAKQVATKAQVNVVMSDKALVRQLQKELARLENELRALKSRSPDEHSALALKEKEVVIEKMDKEMRELMMQRDIAQSRMQNLLRSRPSWGEMSYQSETPEYAASEASETPFHMEAASRFEAVDEACDDQFLSDETSPRLFIDKYFGPDPCKDWQVPSHRSDHSFPDSCKEVKCIEMDSINGSIDFNEASSHEEGDPDLGYQVDVEPMGHSRFSSDTDISYSNNMPRNRIGHNMDHKEQEKLQDSESLDVKEQNFKVFTTPNEDAKNEEAIAGKVFTTESKFPANDDFLDVIVKEHNFKTSMDDAAASEVGFAPMPNEAMPDKNDDPKHVPEKQGPETETDLQETHKDWSQEFEKQRREIIELWDVCHVPLVHRTYFFLLFKGDPTDAVYMEVELRRLHFLKNSWSQGEKIVKDGQHLTEAASIKAMKREREMLCRQMVKIFSASERNELFQQWGIGLNTKQRRLQLCNKLWKDTKDLEHLKESAALVAKLVGIVETNEASKAIFGLSFAPQTVNLKSYSWAPRMPFMI